jgi:hypothetical protein
MPWTDPRTRVGTHTGAAAPVLAQGGRRYVVSMGAPGRSARRKDRMAALKRIVPGYPDPANVVSEVDRASWTGIGHLFGLPDVAMLSVPDLADACGVDEREPTPLEQPPVPEEQFVECAASVAPPPPPSVARVFEAPRCDEDGYLEWAHALHLVAALVARRRGEVQLVASLPLPTDGSPAERDLRGFLTAPGRMLALRIREASPGFASAFVQLAYPWVRTRGSARLPEELEPPEGVLAGLLAQNTLTRGAYRSASGQPTTDAYAVFPEVTSDQLTGQRRAAAGAPAMTGLPLHERVSIFGNTPAGLLLLSDVTTSLDESYRPASVNRLVSLVVRAARIVGEESVFEPSGERLWVELRERLRRLLLQLYRAGALRGATRPGLQRAVRSQHDVAERSRRRPGDRRDRHRADRADRDDPGRARHGRQRPGRARRRRRQAGCRVSRDNELSPLHAFHFQVDFDEDSLAGRGGGSIPLCSGAFSECTGLEATMEPKVIKEGGRNYGPAQRAGTVTFATVVLKRRHADAASLAMVRAPHPQGGYAHRWQQPSRSTTAPAKASAWKLERRCR